MPQFYRGAAFSSGSPSILTRIWGWWGSMGISSPAVDGLLPRECRLCISEGKAKASEWVMLAGMSNMVQQSAERRGRQGPAFSGASSMMPVIRFDRISSGLDRARGSRLPDMSVQYTRSRCDLTTEGR
nr:hypothetical protein CFP56_11872 [Quercus suber]